MINYCLEILIGGVGAAGGETGLHSFSAPRCCEPEDTGNCCLKTLVCSMVFS